MIVADTARSPRWHASSDSIFSREFTQNLDGPVAELMT